MSVFKAKFSTNLSAVSAEVIKTEYSKRRNDNPVTSSVKLKQSSTPALEYNGVLNSVNLSLHETMTRGKEVIFKKNEFDRTKTQKVFFITPTVCYVILQARTQSFCGSGRTPTKQMSRTYVIMCRAVL